MAYNLTPKQKALLSEIVAAVRSDVIPEEFMVIYTMGGSSVMQAQDHPWANEFTKGKLDALEQAGLI
jgi:hypothetical protein